MCTSQNHPLYSIHCRPIHPYPTPPPPPPFPLAHILTIVYKVELFYCEQLVDTKSGDKKTTLMHFLVQTVQDKFPELLNFDSELRFLDKAALGRLCAQLNCVSVFLE